MLDLYFEKVKKVVLEEKKVYGELPEFDYGRYTFLACYMPNASGDGMEHRNSTMLTSTTSLAEGGLENNIGTVSHEFFHAWNVERIRPKSLEPFNFEEANMSGELWFAEGFTSYYTDLILCRAGLISPEEYIEGLAGTFNYVWNSPARKFFNPIEMSYQAPFVDAATAVDPVNRENTFISYYSYGSVLGLALDLSLRQIDLNLDDYMKLLWQTYGKPEIGYTVQHLHEALNNYAGKAFGEAFFGRYIYSSTMPDFNTLFSTVGVVLQQDSTLPYFGAAISVNELGLSSIVRNTQIESPAYKAGLDYGDTIRTINGIPLPSNLPFNEFIHQFKVGDALEIAFTRHGVEKVTTLVLESSPAYTMTTMEKNGLKPSKKMMQQRGLWLKTRQL
jgi:predicted metalloprotease with PDZ domain